MPVFLAIDYTAERILSSGSVGLIAFAVALLIWDLALAVRGVMVALNAVHNTRETRGILRRSVTALWLALAVGASLVGSVLIVVVGGRAVDAAVLDAILGILRWGAAACLLGIAVGLLVRYAPAERPETRWASAGSAIIVGTWIGASVLFGVFVRYVADFTTPTGALTVFLVLTAYVFVSSAIFVIGAQFDELLRQETRG